MHRAVGLTTIAACLAIAGLLLADPGAKSAGDKPAPARRQAATKQEPNRQDSTRPDNNTQEKNAQENNTADKKKTPMAVTPEREAAVRTFVERNHPELAGLLAHLKDSQPKEYERAVRELHRVTERLAGIQERDPLQYELEIKLWTAQSQVQLLAARLKMGQTNELKDQLRQAIGEQADAKVALLKHEKARVAERLSRIDRDIARFEGERDEAIEKQLELLTRTNKPGQIAQPSPGKSSASKTTKNRSSKVSVE